MIAFLYPVIVGLAVWRITEAIQKKRSTLLLLICVVASFVGWYLGIEMFGGRQSHGVINYGPPVVPAGICAGLVSAIAAFIYSKINNTPPTGS